MFREQLFNRFFTGVKATPIELLVIQPTPFCNIDCSYCYLSDRNNRKQLAAETLTWLCRRVFSSSFLAEQLSIIWHAGEPLVLAPTYYRELFAVIDQLAPQSLAINHCIQTNGMLINDDWLTLIEERSINVGISLDGPQLFHDRNRLTRSGKGTFAATLKGIQNLQKAGIDFHVITVLTAEALFEPDEFFDFYVDNGIQRVCFNVEEIEGPHRQSSLQQTPMLKAYSRFLHRFIERIKTLPPTMRLSVREIDATVGLITQSTQLPIWNHQVEPFAILSMDVDGNLSTFSPELLGITQAKFNNFVFGNVYTHSLDEVLKHPALRRTYTEIRKGIKRCRQQCAYFPYCNGGAPANKWFENQSFDSCETLYCRLTKKALLDLVLEELECEFAMSNTLDG